MDLRYRGAVRHRIVLGAGDDALVVRYRARLDSEGELDGGPGFDRLTLPGFAREDEVNDVLVDNDRGVAMYDDVEQAHWTRFESFGLPASWAEHSTFIGSDTDEEVRSVGGLGTIAVDTRGGDDHVRLSGPPDPGAALDAGPGDDKLTLEEFGDLDVRIPDGTALGSGEWAGGPVTFAGFDRFRVSAATGDLTVLGTDGADRVKGAGDGGVVMRGLGGDDRFGCWLNNGDTLPCGPMVLRGGPGADRLVGSARADLLVGGSGRDVAVGNAAKDRCLGVERRVSC